MSKNIIKIVVLFFILFSVNLFAEPDLPLPEKYNFLLSNKNLPVPQIYNANYDLFSGPARFSGWGLGGNYFLGAVDGMLSAVATTKSSAATLNACSAGIFIGGGNTATIMNSNFNISSKTTGSATGISQAFGINNNGGTLVQSGNIFNINATGSTTTQQADINS